MEVDRVYIATDEDGSPRIEEIRNLGGAKTVVYYTNSALADDEERLSPTTVSDVAVMVSENDEIEYVSMVSSTGRNNMTKADFIDIGMGF